MPATPIAERLARVGIFQELALGDIERWASGMKVREFLASTVLYTSEDVSERMLVLLEGRVDIFRLTPDGKRLVTRRVEPGGIFGARGLWRRIAQGEFAEALDEGSLCAISREAMLCIMAQHPMVAARMLSATYDHLAHLAERLEKASFWTVRERVSDFPLANMDSESREVAGFSHADIGDVIGALRQTVTETLADLREHRLVEIRRKRISVVNVEELEELALGAAFGTEANGARAALARLLGHAAALPPTRVD